MPEQLQQTTPRRNSSRKIQPRSILTRHFFRRFFDNDTLSIEGETETTVIRALAFCAVPSLMVAFWLMPHYPGRDLLASAADRYFFVLYSFVVMGMVTTFEWEMLFPDRADFLILLPLPLQAKDLFSSKSRALITFLAMFLIAANVFPLILYSAVSTASHGNYLHTVVAHFAATTLAGVFSAFAMLAIEGFSIALVPDHLLRYISPILQALAITTLLLMLLLFPLVSSHLAPLLNQSDQVARFLPPLWFLGLYESLALGTAAPPSSSALAQFALDATAAATILAILAYPAAWARQRKRALEGASREHGQRFSPIAALLHKTLLRVPQQRAIFHFITQTITRNTHYQVYLAIYTGAGLALALACILSLHPTNGSIQVALSTRGLHAILPLLLFWMAIGLRSAFAFPVDMRSRWVFPINLPLIGPTFLKAAKLFTLLCLAILTVTILAFLIALKWPWWHIAIQLVWGATLSILFAELFFIGRTQIPFTRPRMPGRASLPILLTLYAAIFPALVILTVKAEQITESKPLVLLEFVIASIALHLILKGLDQLAQRGIIGGFPEDETDEGPQTLGLLPSTQR